MSGVLGPPISFAFLLSLFLSFLLFSSFCSIAFLDGVKCCSEVNAAKTPLSYSPKSYEENLIHVARFGWICVSVFTLFVLVKWGFVVNV